MRLTKTLTGLIAIALISGCASTITSPKSVTSEVRRSFNEFTKVIAYYGPSIDRQGRMGLGSHYLAAFRNEKSRVLEFTFFISDTYSGEARLYDSAYDSNGNRLKLERRDLKIYSCRSRYDCNYSEDVNIDMSLAYLQRHVDEGIKLQIRSQRGSAVFEIPGVYIKGFLAALPELS